MAKMPRPDEETKELFRSLVPEHPGVTVRPMFGQLAAFVHGNMFMGIFGPDVLVRLPEEEREAIMAQGGTAFEPMAGRPMREYVVLPPQWRDDRAKLEEWVARSIEWAEELPPKQPKKKKR